MTPMLRRLTLAVAATATVAAGCRDREEGGSIVSALRLTNRPDSVPVVLNADLPFRYPAELYERRIQGNVTLRLFIDREGRVLPESTQISEQSGYEALDSAAVRAAPELQFRPALLRGEPIPVWIHFPVYFRHPEARPLPGDTVLQRTPPTR